MGIGAGLALGLSDAQLGNQSGQIAGGQEAFQRQMALRQFMLQQQAQQRADAE